MFYTLALINTFYNDWKVRFKFSIPWHKTRHLVSPSPPPPTPTHTHFQVLALSHTTRDLACMYAVTPSHMSELCPQPPHSCPLATGYVIHLQSIDLGKSPTQVLEASSGSSGQEILGTQVWSMK